MSTHAGPRLGHLEFQVIANAEVKGFFDSWMEKRKKDRNLYPLVMSEDEWWTELITYLRGGEGDYEDNQRQR